MSSDYNSRLISNLYKATDYEEIERILDDMEEIGDGVFLQPLLDAYQKHKNSSFSHYFFGPLSRIRSENAGKELNNLLLTHSGDDSKDLVWILHALNEISYYSDDANEVADILIKSYVDSIKKDALGLGSIDLDYALGYAKGAETLEKYEEILQEILFLEYLSRAEKSIALSYLLRLNPKKGILFLIDNYEDKIDTNEELETIIAKELLGWKGGNILKLKDLIIKKSKGRAKEILEEERKQDTEVQQKAKQQEVEKESNTYANMGIVKEIRELRKKINTLTQIKPDFQFRLLPHNELVFDQTIVTEDKGAFISALTDLRFIVVDIDKETKGHGFDDLTAMALLPTGVTKSELGKSLNQLYLFLTAKKIKTDDYFLRLRKLNQILSLLSSHPEAETKIVKILTEIGVIDEYKNDEWAKLHLFFLNDYKQILEDLHSALA